VLPDAAPRPAPPARHSGQREVDRGLGEVELRLRQADVLDRLCRRDGDDERVRVGETDVLGGENDHPPGDEAGVLPRLEHRGQVVDGRVGIRAAHRLDEGRREVVVAVTGAVVDGGRLRAASSTSSVVSGAPPAVCHASGTPSAVRASPPAFAAMSAATSSETSSRARLPAVDDRGEVVGGERLSAYTWQRDRSAELTSKYGFSVVAPIRVITPSSTDGSNASCCALLKRWISSRKRIVRRPSAPSRSLARARTARTSATEAETAESSSNAAPVAPAMIRASVVLPLPGGP
jgi:hypothetical protein